MKTTQQVSPVWIESLTRRESAILARLAEGKSNREIAEGEVLALSTVKWYINQILGKLGCANRGEALARAREIGLLEEAITAYPPIPRNNLPRQLTSFVGREQVIARLVEEVANAPLVTLTGAGGSGKTRLALKAGESLLAQAQTPFQEGIFLADLAALSDPRLLPQVIAASLGLGEASGQTTTQQMIDFLEKRRLLLVLDNCEHLLDAVASMTEELLKHCPDLHILATSREKLRVTGELTFRVPSLEIPDAQQLLPLEELTRVEAVRLFIERARLVLPDYALSQEDTAAITRLCQRLDGIPLAIELAAAWMDQLSLEQINIRLDDNFALLTGGSRTALPRYKTIRASIDWSYTLLSEHERLLLQRISVFTGGWTLETAEGVCAFGELREQDILDGLASLVNKSLLVIDLHARGGPRYTMLEITRQYAREKLKDPGEETLLRERHLACFLRLAEQIAPELRGRTQIPRLDQLEADLANLRQALGWALQADLEAELRMASALMWFWHLRSQIKEGVQWIEKGLARAEWTSLPALVRARALAAAGCHYDMLGTENDNAERALKESLRLFREAGPAGQAGTAFAFDWLGDLYYYSDPPLALSYLNQAFELYQTIEDPYQRGECRLFTSTCLWYIETGSKEARRLLGEALAIFQAMGDPDAIATAYWQLGIFAKDEMDLAQARTWFEQSQVLYRQVGNQDTVSLLWINLGDLAKMSGDWSRAIACYQKAIRIQDEVMSRPFFALCAYSSLEDIALILSNHRMAHDAIHTTQAFAEKLHNSLYMGLARIHLGVLAWEEGDQSRARAEFEQILSQFEADQDEVGLYIARIIVGRMLITSGGKDEADLLIRKALAYSATRRHQVQTSWPLDGLACMAARDQPEKAARLFGAAERMNPYQVNALFPSQRTARESDVAKVKAILGEERFAVLWAEGKGLSFDEAVALAMA